MKYSYAAVSDVGKREINEDALEVRAGRCYLACALGDGLGGQGSGDFASKLATDVSIRRMSGFLPIGRRTLDACVREANRLIRDQQEEQHCRMMTTLALLRLSGARTAGVRRRHAHLLDSRRRNHLPEQRPQHPADDGDVRRNHLRPDSGA